MSTSSFASRIYHAGRLILLAVAVGTLGSVVSTKAPHFYPDDPMKREPESQDASKAQPYQIGSLYEMTNNLFVTSGYKPSGTRAQNLNTIDEVPDSSWFTNRIGTTKVTAEEIARGPIRGGPPDPSRWVLIREKTSGVHPGFTARDAKGETWFLEFDPPAFPEGATGAVAVATKIFWAFGYNQVESFLTTFDLKHVEIDPKATVRRPSGKRTRYTHDDMNAILEHVAQNADGTYRVVAGRLIPGKILGGFQYVGTRPDDPNDVVPHEHRRELRALRVFGAWANLTDLKAANTLDALVTENGRSIVKHYLQDVGSTFGMCNEKYEWDLSWEHFYQADTTRRRLFSFGFALSPWQTVKYDEYPSIGKFEGDRFDPRKWRPQTLWPTITASPRNSRNAGRTSLGRGAGRTVQRSEGGAVSWRRTDQAPRQDHEHLSDRREPDRRSTSRCERPPDLRKRGIRGGGCERPGKLSRVLVSLRQRDGRNSRPFRNAERDDNNPGASRPADGFRQLRRGRSVRRQRSTPDVAAGDPHLFPPRRRRLGARGARTVAREPLSRSGGAEAAALIEWGLSPHRALPSALTIRADRRLISSGCATAWRGRPPRRERRRSHSRIGAGVGRPGRGWLRKTSLVGIIVDPSIAISSGPGSPRQGKAGAAAHGHRHQRKLIAPVPSDNRPAGRDAKRRTEEDIAREVPVVGEA